LKKESWGGESRQNWRRDMGGKGTKGGTDQGFGYYTTKDEERKRNPVSSLRTALLNGGFKENLTIKKGQRVFNCKRRAGEKIRKIPSR